MNPRARATPQIAEMLIAKLEVLRAEAVTESFLPMVYSWTKPSSGSGAKSNTSGVGHRNPHRRERFDVALLLKADIARQSCRGLAAMSELNQGSAHAEEAQCPSPGTTQSAKPGERRRAGLGPAWARLGRGSPTHRTVSSLDAGRRSEVFRLVEPDRPRPPGPEEVASMAVVRSGGWQPRQRESLEGGTDAFVYELTQSECQANAK